MADRYVWSGATGTATGADWTNAHLTLGAAMDAWAEGPDRIYVAHDHNEVSAVSANYGKGTANYPTVTICVDRLGTFPPVAADITTGAQIRTSVAGAEILFGGWLTFIGLIFKPGDGAGTGAADIIGIGLSRQCYFYNCLFDLSGHTGNSRFRLDTNGFYAETHNCQWKFGGTGQRINCAGYIGGLVIKNHGQSIFATGSVIPTNLFLGPYAGFLQVEGADLSAMGTNALFANDYGCNRLVGCKLAAGAVIAAGARAASVEAFIEVVDCDEVGGGYRHERYHSADSVTVSDSATYLTGGTSIRGIPLSWRMVGGYYNNYDHAHYSFEGVMWNEEIGVPRTLTWELLSNFTFTDAEIWVEVDYYAESTSPLTTTVDNVSPGVLMRAAGTAWPASAAAWTNPGALTTKQQMTITFTPQRSGPLRWRIGLGSGFHSPATDKFIHIDPTPVLT